MGDWVTVSSVKRLLISANRLILSCMAGRAALPTTDLGDKMPASQNPGGEESDAE